MVYFLFCSIQWQEIDKGRPPAKKVKVENSPCREGPRSTYDVIVLPAAGEIMRNL